MVLLVLTVGKMQLFPQQFDPDGLGHFATDGQKYRVQTGNLTDILLRDGPVAWLRTPSEFHVRLHSLFFLVSRPLFGSTVLAFEPLNLICYLTILALTFELTQKLAGRQAALLASIVVGLLPSLLLHTTQPLRDPLFIAALLASILVITNLLTEIYGWCRALTVGGLGIVAQLVLWIVRPDMWQGLRTIAFLGLAFGLIRMWLERKFLFANLVGLAMLVLLVSMTFKVPLGRYGEMPNTLIGPFSNSLSGRIALMRHRFILNGQGQSGSNIDEDVEFSGPADEIRYLPRAVEIGYFAPFPAMWFNPGYAVGQAGRILAGIETLLTYVIEFFACLFVWRNRRSLIVWFIVSVTVIGVVPLGMVVVNIGTLYRMRYAFWVLIVALSSGGMVMLARRRKNEIDIDGVAAR